MSTEEDYSKNTLYGYLIFVKRHLGIEDKEALELIQNFIVQAIIKKENEKESMSLTQRIEP